MEADIVKITTIIQVPSGESVYEQVIAISVPASNKTDAEAKSEGQKMLSEIAFDNDFHRKLTERAYPTRGGGNKKAAAQATGDNTPDKMELKVGKIMEANIHPDADTLCILSVDIGSDTKKSIVSNLMAYYGLEDLRSRTVVTLTNMKSSKIRGVESEGLVLCAFNQDKYEPLIVPESAKIGERIIAEGFNNTKAEVAQLNPKKKVWEKIQAELKTNSDGDALWKDFSLLTMNGDKITSSLKECNIK
ncbi:tyrosine--tRNA ligase, cytoplasmic-like [Toxorhynchites rutilus septentrionalis]|uniref:tyrosine--tRNA ligase, cytoplasmic-like n=1 Tax=Toxorhynchites rutilus septentrionalis TaxID=329112 RepID=UPI002478B4A6|nr:tyrosine--tRNA ligase, cytoplasmic-like [Toxorhynchites rutilus septentrionalis]